MKVKVCGMRDKTNIEELITIPLDFIGFIFHEKSSRNIEFKPKVVIPKNIKKVGVFVNKPKDFILKKATEFDLDYIQLHGNESPEFCKELRKHIKIIKAFNIKQNFDFELLKNYESHCDLFLFDAFGKQAGGNGITFNWDLLDNYHGNIPFLLSGGIDGDMTSAIKKIKHPQFIGVDVNSGFEIKPALKNINKIKLFYNELHS
jgi:phosphoribosylanthranilate isomerase